MDNDTPLKRCIQCQRELPATTEFFHKSGKKNPLRGRCKFCHSKNVSSGKRISTLYQKELLGKGLKRCCDCRRELTISEEYFHLTKHSSDGFKSFCIECEAKRSRDYYHFRMDADTDYRAKHNATGMRTRQRHEQDNPIGDPSKTKVCTSCKREFAATLEYFSKHTGCKYNVSSRCKECMNSESREQFANNPLLRSQLAQNNRKRIAQLQITNPEKYRNSERIRTERRRTIKEGLPVDFTVSDWEACLEYWSGCCCICGRAPGLWNSIVQEHWIAVSDTRPDNPGTVPWNILPMCHATRGSTGLGACNQSKKAKDPVVWLEKYLGKRAAKKKIAEIEAYFTSVRR